MKQRGFEKKTVAFFYIRQKNQKYYGGAGSHMIQNPVLKGEEQRNQGRPGGGGRTTDEPVVPENITAAPLPMAAVAAPANQKRLR